MSARLPVDVITGFLGAGKTTLLRRLLARPELAGAAVLVNEFGEIGLDHLLLERIDGDVVLLKSGCVCCTVRGDLKAALEALLGRRARGEIAFDRVAIETTGLADPTPVFATIAADAALKHRLRMGAVVCVVDALNGAATLDAHDVSLRQAAAADRIVVSKTDLAPPEACSALAARLRALNPVAELLLLDAETPPPALWLTGAGEGPPSRWRADTPAAEPGHDARAFLLEAEAPLDWARFGLWLSMLLNAHGDDILRLKGVVAIEGVAGPVAIQGVQRVVHAPEHLEAWPDGDARTRLVVIARTIDPERVRRSFRAFVGRAGTNAAAASA
ncbi:CobW family GTP-binding protein [Chenggangzhangella methanolivorans]|uniref:GTP-binding protein n=1 Tax=Chenggangzhangella methanolivorans TaxID=1437009 RepID=A0A9E6R8Q8_9HYPH|nr:GTP-binding protein [Chenggangzhangella methanolivorans]QZO00281.1 GTP-binding protein [Chenggangzhangella methanolivorans]